MGGTQKLLLAAATVSALVGITGAAPASRGALSSAPVTRVAIAFPVPAVAGGPRGIAVAKQVGDGSRVQIHVSLHRLKPNTTYYVVENSRPCSQIVDAADNVLWRWVLRTTDGGATYKARSVPRRGELTDARSVRVYEVLPSGAVRQRSCGITGTYDSGTGVLTLAAQAQGSSFANPTTAMVAYPAGPGGVRGIVVAEQSGQSTRLRLHVSLQGLKSSSRYRVTATTGGCRVTNFDITFPRGFRTDNSGDIGAAANVTRQGALRRARTVRVHETAGGTASRQRACGPTSFYEDSGRFVSG